jgi:hypothetical protein
MVDRSDVMSIGATPHSAVPYLLGKHSQRGIGKKLTKHDVADMRQWVRGEGITLPLPAQIKWLTAAWPCVSETTIREILTNTAWCDPAYDRETRLPDAPLMPSFGLLASWIALIQLLFGEVTCSRSPSTDL